jgi:hypothetical protein
MKYTQNITLAVLMLLFGTTFMGCASESSDIAPGGDSGVGGSLARFMIAGNYLYTVDNQNIKTISLTNPADPVLVNEQKVAEGVESIFRLGDKLFIGSSTGLFLYTFGADGIPQLQGAFLYSEFNFPIYPCDPVVANDTYAYVTLNSTVEVEQCRRNTTAEVRVLNIFDVSNIQHPQLLAQYPMDNPQGVGLDGNLLFICEQQFGLKVFDVSNPAQIQLIAQLQDFTAHDVIPLGGLLLVVGPDNVYQVDYRDLNNIHVLSQIPIGA